MIIHACTQGGWHPCETIPDGRSLITADWRFPRLRSPITCAYPCSSGWRVVRDAPHALLFPRTAVVVHHGGSGTTAQALRAGVPQVLLPLILDQFHHAHRLHLAGIAPRPVPMEKITAAELAEAIHAALKLPEGPRLKAAARLRASDGSGQIVRRIEAMAA